MLGRENFEKGPDMTWEETQAVGLEAVKDLVRWCENGGLTLFVDARRGAEAE